MRRSSLHVFGVMTLALCATILVDAGRPTSAAETKSIAIITMVDTPQLVEVKDGIIKGLAAHGYVDGKNLKINFKSAQSNFGTAQQIARQFIGEAPDVIVSITTPASQAVVAATKDLPVIFTVVTDPVSAKLVSSKTHPGGNVSGVSDVVPTERQIGLVKEIVPGLKTLGLLYDSASDSSRASAESIKALGPKMGFTVVEAAAMGLNNVASAAQSLVGRVDAIFVPNDTTVYAAFESVVRVAQDAHVPLFSAERRSVQRGSIGTVGFDFGQIGVKTADMIYKVLSGTKPGDMDVIYMVDEPDTLGLYLNKASAEKMGVTVPKALLEHAAIVF
jgi:putative tryptophan/tyrosine transport system substrate-binding protein